MSEGRMPSQQIAVRVLIAGFILTIVSALVLVIAARLGDGQPIQLPVAQQATKQLTSTSAPSPTTQTMSEEEAAIDAATQVPQLFHDVEADVRTDPSSVLDKLDQYDRVADGPLLDESKADAADIPYTGFRQSGAAEVTSVEVLAVDLDNSRDITPPGPSVTLHVCTDVSAALYERAGEPWTPDDSVLSGTWDVRNYQYPDPAGWRVWQIEGSDRSC